MKKGLRVVCLTAVLVVSMFLLTACGSKNPIVGQWKYNSGSYIYTFKEDGTGSYEYLGSKMEFTYTLDGNKISILYNGSTSPFESEYSIDGNTLNIKDSFGNDTLYTKQ